MKPSHHAEPTQSAPTRYAPSVPMSVYRELAAELRANKAVIDSLNSRNQQLLEQNQRLKQEIHNVVQATLNLGQFAGVARPATPDERSRDFPSAIAPDTLAKLVRAQGEARKIIANEPIAAPEQVAPERYRSEPQLTPEQTEQYGSELYGNELYDAQDHHAQAEQIREQQARAQEKAAQAQARARAQAQQQAQAQAQARAQARAQAQADKAARAARAQQAAQASSANPAARNRVPRPIQTAPAQVKSPDKAPVAKKRAAAAPNAGVRQPSQRADMLPTTGKPLPKLFTEQAGDYRTNSLESTEDKEIGGIWLALSIIGVIR